VKRYSVQSPGLVLSLAAAASAVLVMASQVFAAPSIVNGRNFAGQFDPTPKFVDSCSFGPEHYCDSATATGAVGPTRYIQMVNSRFAIYTRANTSTIPISSGELGDIAGVPPTHFGTYPQIIWDPTTDRFYYSMNASTGRRDVDQIAFGWSKTKSPNSPADFCHYFFDGIRDVRLGDSQHFLIFGSTFRSAVMAIGKPPAGTDCPAFESLPFGIEFALRTEGGELVRSPSPANEIDTLNTGYVLAGAPGQLLPIYENMVATVTRNPISGNPIFGRARSFAIPDDSLPIGLGNYAPQPGIHEFIRIVPGTSSPVVARNPARGGAVSLWSHRTVRAGTTSGIRWYEIDPATPRLLRTGLIYQPGVWKFNAAISPDRRVDGDITEFGDSFVVQYNEVSREKNISPRICAASSFKGQPVVSIVVRNAVGPYNGEECKPESFGPYMCPWGSYAGAAPDPRPVTAGRGVVWGTNQFAGSTNTSYEQSNWRTRMFAVRP
jgi:hypothetical protein